jgi:hypothetical protein
MSANNRFILVARDVETSSSIKEKVIVREYLDYRYPRDLQEENKPRPLTSRDGS